MGWKKADSMRRSVALGAMRRRAGQRSGFTASAIRLASGSLYNSRLRKGESIRVFPLSNWTELDIWLYLYAEEIPIVPLYFAKERELIRRGGALTLYREGMKLLPGEKVETMKVRMRSLGCAPCTGAMPSDADTLPKIIEELMTFRRSERENRAIDHDEEGSMETKKREGYF
jgi:sulfate adenylyltransferase subunit 2